MRDLAAVITGVTAATAITRLGFEVPYGVGYEAQAAAGLQLEDADISSILPVKQRPAQPGSAALLRKLLPFTLLDAPPSPVVQQGWNFQFVQQSSTCQGSWEAYLVPSVPDQQPRKVAIGTTSSPVLAAVMVATALARLGYRYRPDGSSKQLVLEDEGLIAELLQHLNFSGESVISALELSSVEGQPLQYCERADG
ncbi:hypothetical protein OEZ85_012279 [Tetradesmus obliquus]|uniref:Uncharacterized protein n=1 Tax=Tetradesmus obliquus TaxID=3088 RepID=A0ABY8TSZ9_TETOB|nr:hypothetical protein OEZ85_012279 [Tetradesmus obliquus]